MLPWLGFKFLIALYSHCTRQRLNKCVSFTSAGSAKALALQHEPTLCIFVPVWRENETQLRRTLLSVRNGFYTKERVTIMIVIDEVRVHAFEKSNILKVPGLRLCTCHFASISARPRWR